jgi:hypothetical protein
MKSVAVVFPILPGQADAFKKFRVEVKARSKELAESRRKKNVSREAVWMQKTPMGDFGIVLIEGDDALKSNQMFAASNDPYDVWFKKQLAPITGLDWNQPVPPVEIIYDYRAGATAVV